jgi:hypothetical protein
MGGFFAKLLQKTDRLNTLFRVFSSFSEKKTGKSKAVSKAHRLGKQPP